MTCQEPEMLADIQWEDLNQPKIPQGAMVNRAVRMVSLVMNFTSVH